MAPVLKTGGRKTGVRLLRLPLMENNLAVERARFAKPMDLRVEVRLLCFPPRLSGKCSGWQQRLKVRGCSEVHIGKVIV